MEDLCHGGNARLRRLSGSNGLSLAAEQCMPYLTASGVMSALFETSQAAQAQTQKIGRVDV